MGAGLYYATWYPQKWLPRSGKIPYDLDAGLKSSMKRTASLSRRLARTIFHSMAKYGPKLDRQQLLLGRLVDTAAELLTISLSAARAYQLGDKRSIQTAQYLCDRGIHRCEQLLNSNGKAPDNLGYSLARKLLDQK